MQKQIVDQAADNLRILAAAMVEKAKSGHPGGAMGGADFINLLYTDFLRYDPSDMGWIHRDRFFLDPGHMSPMLYGVLTLAGFYTLDEIKQFRQWGSPTPGHPEVDVLRGIENTSGPLGQGHAMAVGAAIAAKFLAARFGSWMNHKVYTFISDGGVQEEISQGAGRIAGHLGLDNLVMFYDSNDIQLSTLTNEVTSEDTAMKYRAWGWHVTTINGNDANEIHQALSEARSIEGKPVLIIGRTIMGKGAIDPAGGCYERKCATHGMPLGEAGASFEKTIANLGGDPENPFQIFPEVATWYAEIREKKIKEAAALKKQEAEWAAQNPELAKKLETFFSGRLPEIDWQAIAQKPGIATRAASSTVLSVLAEKVENLIVSSADLSNSDKTDGFLKKSRALTSRDFGGAFLQAGVSELTMACLCNGMALHGGVIAACATFFVFSDYMKPALRIAALMEVPVKFIWTHDAFRVGEDGPTHQPIEQEAQVRLMEQLKNHSGRNSTRVLRPADAAETTVAWKMAMENFDTPSALILSRQNIKDIPAVAASRYEEALQAEKGAYVAWEQGSASKPDLILVANGSEVSTCIEGAVKLVSEGLTVRVVSAISEGLFRTQPAGYQEKVLPAGIPVMGLTAGLPVTLQGLVGPFGIVAGLDHFGYSAPYTVLDEKLGYTAESVFRKALDYLASRKA